MNTNKKIRESTGYFIFLLKMPRLIEIQSAQIVALLEAGLSKSLRELYMKSGTRYLKIQSEHALICKNV